MLAKLKQTIQRSIEGDSSPVVVFSALWPIIRFLRASPQSVPEIVIDMLLEAVGPSRTLLMPTFTTGYKNGICDLDAEPGNTGALAEAYRKRFGVGRTLSAFFSFAVAGPQASLLLELQPRDAWGDGSIYAHLEDLDAHFLMLGTHPTHCSYLHRIEWLARDHIPYRYTKSFNGTIIRNKTHFPISERLYVRQIEPAVVNDFTVLSKPLQLAGMQVCAIEGVQISSMRAKIMRDTVLPLILANPLALIKDVEQYRKGT